MPRKELVAGIPFRHCVAPIARLRQTFAAQHINDPKLDPLELRKHDSQTRFLNTESERIPAAHACLAYAASR